VSVVGGIHRPASTRPAQGPEYFNDWGSGCLPGYLGIVTTGVGGGTARTELAVRGELLAPNGYLHGGTVVALADTTAGYGCMSSLPEGAYGFTTIELKSNHFGTARDGMIVCIATATHLGRTTQVWDAVVTASDRTLAAFRCTQLLLYPDRR
jgi:1,4-dihydroxy-2-naphthoyl-CoA hydrolase